MSDYNHNKNVNDMADEIIEEAKDERLGYEEILERLEQSVDSSVIYTADAKDILLNSDNDSAGPDELGADGFDYSNGMPWSALAYFALRRDILDRMFASGFDINTPEESYPDMDDMQQVLLDAIEDMVEMGHGRADAADLYDTRQTKDDEFKEAVDEMKKADEAPKKFFLEAFEEALAEKADS